MRSQALKKTLIGGALLLLALSMMATDSVWPLQIPLYAAAFCQRVFPQVRIDYAVLAGGIVLLILTVALSHLTLAWLSRTMRGERWPFRWTVCLFVALFLLFSGGLLAVGMVRDVHWLGTNPMHVGFEGAAANSPGFLANAAAARLQYGTAWVDATITHNGSIEVIDLPGPDGTIQAVIAFPHDPVRQARIGIVIARQGCLLEMRPWQSPAAVIREVTEQIAAAQPATTRPETKP